MSDQTVERKENQEMKNDEDTGHNEMHDEMEENETEDDQTAGHKNTVKKDEMNEQKGM